MKLKWTIEFEVDEIWVADGFNMTDDVAKDMIERTLTYAYPDETSAKVIESPNIKEIMRIQGHKV